VTIGEAYEHYIRQRTFDGTYSAQSIVKVQSAFNRWIFPQLGLIDVEQLAVEDLVQLQERMQAAGLSTSAQTSVLAFARALLKYISEQLHISCIAQTLIRLPKRQPSTPAFLTNDEVRHMRSAIGTRSMPDLRLRAFVELLLATGMRLTEALSLDRLPFDSRVDSVEIVGKGGKKRTVFFNEECHFWIRNYLAARIDRHPALFVTTTEPTERWSTMDVSRFFIRLRRQAGISKHLTPHLLRHTFCTNLRDNGADITVIKELAGHSDIDTTVRYYLGTDKRALRAALNKHLHYRTSEDLTNRSAAA